MIHCGTSWVPCPLKRSCPVHPQDIVTAKRYSWAALAILILSLAVVVSGMVWTWRIGQASNHLYHQLAHLQEATSVLRSAAAEVRR